RLSSQICTVALASGYGRAHGPSPLVWRWVRAGVHGGAARGWDQSENNTNPPKEDLGANNLKKPNRMQIKKTKKVPFSNSAACDCNLLLARCLDPALESQ